MLVPVSSFHRVEGQEKPADCLFWLQRPPSVLLTCYHDFLWQSLALCGVCWSEQPLQRTGHLDLVWSGTNYRLSQLPNLTCPVPGGYWHLSYIRPLLRTRGVPTPLCISGPSSTLLSFSAPSQLPLLPTLLLLAQVYFLPGMISFPFE